MPAFRISGTRATPLPSLAFDDGQCASPVPCDFKIAQVVVVEPNAVRAQRAAVQYPERFEQRRRRHLVLRQRVLVLFPRLGKVDEQRHAVTIRKRARSLQVLLRDSV